MIKSWRHKGLRDFFETGTIKGIQSKHKNKLRNQLTVLNVAQKPEDIAVPNWRLHHLKGNLQDHYSISVSGNWRLTFKFEDDDIILLDYQDYH